MMEEDEQIDVTPVGNNKEDAYLKKWSGPLLLGPFVPAIYSVIIIVAGSIVLETNVGTCGNYLDG